jgi:steroid delta-isomerase-like uncharacterized protein
MSSQAPGPQHPPQTHHAVSPETLIQAAKAPIEAYNDKNWHRLRSAVTPDFVYEEVATQRRIEGVDAVSACWQAWAKAFPDSKATFDEACAADGVAVLEVTWCGSHTGLLDLPGGPVAPTNRPIRLQGCQVFTFRDGRVQSLRQYFDIATLLQQLGMLP